MKERGLNNIGKILSKTRISKNTFPFNLTGIIINNAVISWFIMGNIENEIKPKIPPQAKPIGIAYKSIGYIPINVNLKRTNNRREKKLDITKSLIRKTDPNRISIVLESIYVKNSIIAKKNISINA